MICFIFNWIPLWLVVSAQFISSFFYFKFHNGNMETWRHMGLSPSHLQTEIPPKLNLSASHTFGRCCVFFELNLLSSSPSEFFMTYVELSFKYFYGFFNWKDENFVQKYIFTSFLPLPLLQILLCFSLSFLSKFQTSSFIIIDTQARPLQSPFNVTHLYMLLDLTTGIG